MPKAKQTPKASPKPAAIDAGHFQRFMAPGIAKIRKAEDAKRHKAEMARERTMRELRRAWKD